MDFFSLYLHFPFCSKKCGYCDFYSCAKFDDQIFKRYNEKIFEHLDFFKKNISEKISTIYFGGGTPSIFPIKFLDKIVSKIYSEFQIEKNYEWTIEINPENINKNFLDFLKNSPINRLSVGIQSTNSRLLQILGRNCDIKTIHRSVDLLKNYNFPNISFDFISAIPTMTIEDFYSDIEFAEKNMVNHISVYDLTLNEKSFIYKKYETQYDEKLDREKERILKNFLYQQYEVSNFAKRGFNSKHNLSYWKFNNFFGIGPSASGTFFYKNYYRRYESPNDLEKFLSLPADKFYKIQKLSDEIVFFEKIMMGLRLNEGIEKKEFLSKLKPLIEKYPDFFKKNCKNIVLTKKGGSLLNIILREIV